MLDSEEMSQKVLWSGAAVILLGGFVGKQLIWTKVSKEVAINRSEEHEQASRHLATAYANAAKYNLEPLTEEEVKKLKALKLAQGFKDLSKYDPEVDGKGNNSRDDRRWA